MRNGRRARGASARLRPVACALAPLLGLLCGATALAAEPSVRDAAQPPLQIEGMTFMSTEGAHTEIVLQADSAEVDPSTDIAGLERVRARLSGEDGSVSLELTCAEGEFNLRTSQFVAKGDVRGRLADGRSFRGPWLRYDSDTGIAFTDAPVEITDGSRTFRGGGFRYHVREGRLRLTSGASVEEAE